MENTTIRTDQFIHTNQFIVASLDKSTGVFSISSRPLIHTDYATALHESQRLAEIYENKRFIVFGVAAVSQSKKAETAVITSYSI